MLTSILLPVYNGENYIAESIESILTQKGEWELIIQDDCSTDSTEEICQKFVSENVKYFKNDSSLKCWGTLNESALNAKGQLFRLFSHDDIMLEDDILTCAQYMESNPGVGLSFSNYDMIDEVGIVTGSSLDFKERNADLPDVISGNIAAQKLYKWGCISGSHSNITLRRDTYEGISHFNSDMIYTGDYDLLSRVGVYNAIGYNHTKTCQIRFHAQQTSMQGNKAVGKIREMEVILNYLLNNMNPEERLNYERQFSKIYGYYLIKNPIINIGKGDFEPIKQFVRSFGIKNSIGSLMQVLIK